VEWHPTPTFWRDRGVAVTGATGFLGTELTGQLVDLGARVVVLVRDGLPASPRRDQWWPEVASVTGSVEDRANTERMLSEYDVASVFHLAAQSQVGVANRNPASTYEANVLGTWSVLEAVRRSPNVEQVMVASSDKAYGSQPALPYTEDMPLLARNPYDVSKACADLIAQSYAHTFGAPVVVTRCGNFFGPGDINWERLVPGTIRSLLAGERPLIRSDGRSTRDYLYVEDGALAYLQLTEALSTSPELAGQAFNFSSERPLGVLDVVRLLQQAAGTDLEPDVRATATNEIDHQYLSAAKAKAVLGWQPRFTIEDALERTVAWYRDFLGA